MKFPEKPKKQGFTLVELLVVIVIIATLAGAAFSVGQKMMTKARATDAMSNLRQIGPTLITYSTDNNSKLPPIKDEAKTAEGASVEQAWYEACLAIVYPSTDVREFKTDDWWKRNKSFFRNPMFLPKMKPRGFSPSNPGYGMNEMVAENQAINSTGTSPGHLELLKVKVPLASISEPQRTPIVAPCDNFFFRYGPGEISGFQSGTLKSLLSEGKLFVLFLDGHVEPVLPKDYTLRKLHEMPQPSSETN